MSWGAELEKTLKSNSFWYGFHPHLEYEGETEKMIKEIVVVHSKESALVHDTNLWAGCHEFFSGCSGSLCPLLGKRAFTCTFKKFKSLINIITEG